ncbi:uncharacterized protein B0H64DRAFT_105337 [Chaetomium fimeti]|uniref:Uncharacterized protein n=1 Tax=Chaetomium fimeti TaxID=1854472 RepID=A0AAE0LTV0_9PEZI|nr:hypothetical protein B0H64DRAFT_105337 [Chaetomium fimeti]
MAHRPKWRARSTRLALRRWAPSFQGYLTYAFVSFFLSVGLLRVGSDPWKKGRRLVRLHILFFCFRFSWISYYGSL